MSRRPRLCAEGVVYHVTSRGVNKEKIFRAKCDYKKYLFILRECKNKFKFLFYCYALMPNHIHLVLETSSDGTISRIMQRLNTIYAVYINKKRKRVGHLFQGRFFSRIVEKDNYLLELSRYVHLNPIKAGLVNKPEDYVWSSYNDYCKADPKSYFRVVDTDFILNIIANDKQSQIEEYKRFVNSKNFNYDDFVKTIKF
jgi:REP element-mobilizing transposase RayT